MPPLILGSQSPRRKEILSFFSLPFQQASSSFDEDLVPFEGDPQAYAQAIAKGKSDDLLRRFPDALILTADTVVYREGKVYNKPKDEEEAFRYLKELVGTWHSVFTAVRLRLNEEEHAITEETRVQFNALSPALIRHYHSRIHWADKAGGYAIQMAGGLIVKKIDGCYYNVMGLPINAVRTLLGKFGIELWAYVK